MATKKGRRVLERRPECPNIHADSLIVYVGRAPIHKSRHRLATKLPLNLVLELGSDLDPDRLRPQQIE